VNPALSVILPAYNEANRLPPFLASVRRYLDAEYADRYEVIVVDDGSDDGLADVLAAAAGEWPALAVMRHDENQGKGAAVRSGMLAGRGERLLFADADGATPIDEEAKLAEAIAAGADVAIGSRLLAAAESTRRRSWVRGLAGRLFAGLARWWLGVTVRDPQCGFKMFRREAARELFARSEESRYLFDLELLVLANQRGYRVAEVPVNWTEIPGGHLSLAREFVKIPLALWRLRRRLFRSRS
jgi:dolichyl-phosphate beta-glucosyltransferase